MIRLAIKWRKVSKILWMGLLFCILPVMHGTVPEGQTFTEAMVIETGKTLDIAVRNISAEDIGKESANLQIRFVRANVRFFTVYYGSDPNDFIATEPIVVEKPASLLQYQLKDLSSGTRYYYFFEIHTENRVVRTEVCSFLTSSEEVWKEKSEIRCGVNLSSENTNVNFEKIASEFDFVLLPLDLDSGREIFDTYYAQAKVENMSVGAYSTFRAHDLEELQEELSDWMPHICGKILSEPVYFRFDAENDEETDRILLTEMAVMVCQCIWEMGCIPGIAVVRQEMNRIYNMETLTPTCAVWILDALSERNDIDAEMFQYQTSAEIDGVCGTVGLNQCFVDYSAWVQKDVRSDYLFCDFDGTVLQRYQIRAGFEFLFPTILPKRASDDKYQYLFSEWLECEGEEIKEGGKTWIAQYQCIPHQYGNWQSDGRMNVRLCEDCGYRMEVIVSQDIGEFLKWECRDSVLILSGKGRMRSNSCEKAYPWADMADTVTKVIIEDGVLSVGDYAFAEFSNLHSVQLPDTLQKIGAYAFANDDSLLELTFPNRIFTIDETALSGCSKELTFWGYEGSFAQKIADQFSLQFRCLSPQLVQSGGDWDGVRWFYYSDGQLLISGIGHFSSDATLSEFSSRVRILRIGAGITDIEAHTFAFFQGLESVVFLGETPIRIGSRAFAGCTNLFEIHLPKDSVYAADAFDETPILSEFATLSEISEKK